LDDDEFLKLVWGEVFFSLSGLGCLEKILRWFSGDWLFNGSVIFGLIWCEFLHVFHWLFKMNKWSLEKEIWGKLLEPLKTPGKSSD
jgi:hypothetical protein